jgi:hypothetical protein
MGYLEFAKKRKPITAQVKQKISRALKGKRKKKGSSLSNKKKAAISLGVAGGLGVAALALKNRKGSGKEPQKILKDSGKPDPARLSPGPKRPFPPILKGRLTLNQQMKYDRQLGKVKMANREDNISRYKERTRRPLGQGVGRKERISRDPKQNTKKGINLKAIKQRFKK